MLRKSIPIADTLAIVISLLDGYFTGNTIQNLPAMEAGQVRCWTTKVKDVSLIPGWDWHIKIE